MVLFGSFFEALFDLLLVGIFGYTEYFIGIGTFGDDLGDEGGEGDDEKGQVLDEVHITCEVNIYSITYKFDRLNARLIYIKSALDRINVNLIKN